MQIVFIFHGAYGDGTENWIPWIKGELEKRGCEVMVPLFPTPEGQSFDSWMKVFQSYREKLSADSIFIGHSIGATFILSVLESVPAKASFLVAGFASALNHEIDKINQTFYRSFSWEAMRNNCPSFTIFHSDNDPYVPIEKAEELSQRLHSEIIKVPGAGHFNAVAGYTTFPLLLEKVIEKVENRKL